MELDSASIKQMILAEGIDLVGIACADDLLLARPARPALRLMPTAGSVIVMAVSHSLGAVYSPDLKLWTRNKMQTSRLLDRVAEKVGRYLERGGFLSLPVSADKPVEIHKRDFIVEFGQSMITDVDNCIACMKACPMGAQWKNIRPKSIL